MIPQLLNWIVRLLLILLTGSMVGCALKSNGSNSGNLGPVKWVESHDFETEVTITDSVE